MNCENAKVRDCVNLQNSERPTSKRLLLERLDDLRETLAGLQLTDAFAYANLHSAREQVEELLILADDLEVGGEG